MTTYIVEHPTKGILVDQDFEFFDDDGTPVWSSRFAWSKPRTEAWVFQTLETAREAVEKMTGRDRERSQVLMFGTWKVIT